MTTVRTAVYLRLSKDKELDELALDRQLAMCRGLAELRGWSIDEHWVLRENDTSASSGPRPKFEQLLRGMQAGEFDAVLAWKLDRLVRRIDDMDRLMKIADASGVPVATTTGDLDLSTPSGRAQAILWGAISQIEVENLRDRLLAKAHQNRMAGRPTNGGSRPFGWELTACGSAVQRLK